MMHIFLYPATVVTKQPMLFGELLETFCSPSQVEAFFQLLPTAPKCTTLRVNTLKYTVEEAQRLLQQHFNSRGEPFQVQISPDFTDALLVPSIPFSAPSITPATKGKQSLVKGIS